METKYYLYDTAGGTNIKRVLSLIKSVGEYEDYQYGRRWQQDWSQAETWSVLIGLKNRVIRYKYPRNAGAAQYLHEPSNDLISLTALWICDLVPCGVLADKIDDEYGQLHSELTAALRLWERHKQDEDNKRERAACDSIPL